MLKKLFYKLMLLALVGMLFAPFILKRENGTRIMSLDEFLSFDVQLIQQRYTQVLSIIRNFLSEDMKVETLKEDPVNENVTKFYKWQDEKGDWHFSDEKDEKYQQQEIKIRNDRNVLKFEDLPKNNAQGNASKKSSNTQKKSSTQNPLDSKGEQDGMVKGYLNNMTSTVRSAEKVQSQVDNNYQRQSDAIEGLSTP